MYGYNNYYPPFSFFNIYSTTQPNFRFAYPTIDTKIFSNSVKSFPPLLHQGSVLLRHLGNTSFAYKLMDAAQHGRKAQVDHLIKSLGLAVPVTTRYSPTGIVFTLHSRETQDPLENCCSLSLALKWER